MRVFFDNCTSPVLAEVLDAFLRHLRGSAHHIRFLAEMGLNERTADADWISRLGADRPADWIVITGDDHIRRNRAERLVWKQARLKGFVLARGFQRMPLHHRAAALLWRWPDMEAFIGRAAPGSLFELPVRRSSGFVALTV